MALVISVLLRCGSRCGSVASRPIMTCRPRQFRGVARPPGDRAHPAGLTRSHTPGPARMRSTNSRGGRLGLPGRTGLDPPAAQPVAADRHRRRERPRGLLDPPLADVGDQEPRTAPGRTARTRSARRPSTGPGSAWAPAAGRASPTASCRTADPHAPGAGGCAPRGPDRDDPAPPRWRGAASAARPLPRSRACSLHGEPYRAPVAPRHRRFPRRPPGDPRIELLFDPSSRPRPRRDVKSDAGPPYAVSTGHRTRRSGPLRGVMRR